MKQIKFITVIVVAVAISVACTKEMNSKQDQSISQIMATYAENQTKTVLGENGTSILWSPKDEISVFYDGDGMKFTGINSTPKAKTIFLSSGMFLYGGTEGASSEKEYLYGIYPYSSDNAQDGEYLTLTVPAAQTAVEGSFARGAYPSVGRSKDTNIAFYNVCGGICFSVTNSGIKKVVFSGLNNENLAGKVKVAFDQNGKPAVTQTMIGETELVLNVPDEETLETGKLYYISSLPTILSSGFKMVFYTASKHATLTSSSSAEIKRSIFGSVKNADEGLSWEEGGTVVTRVITATLASDTKTSFSEGQLLWDDGQKVFLFDGNKTDTPAIDKQSGQTGTLTTSAMNNTTVFGGIPYENFTVDGESAVCNVPDVQDGSFNSACVELAKTSLENNLSFRPAVSVLKIKISEEVDSIRFSAPGASIVGSCIVDFTGEPAFSSPFITSSSVIAKPASRKSEFYIGILPCTVESMVLDVYKIGVSVQKTIKKTITFTKGQIMTMNAGTLSFGVDLGLSVKWAPCNVGASKPEEYGTYFAWGDVVGQTWNGSSWSGDGFSSYPSYELDESGNLKPEYDAAHVIFGGTWRMPTTAEQKELIDNCTSTWIGDYEGTGIAGRIFTSNKEGYTDKSIFLPAAGYGINSDLRNGNSYGHYWSGSFSYDNLAWGFYFYSSKIAKYGYYHYNGFPIRPVTE